MEVDVTRLQEMHPRLAPTTVADCLHKLALGLARHDHESPVPLEIQLSDTGIGGTLHWREIASHPESFDFNRVTEDAAEAIALAVVHVANGWQVRRRARREEHADWLLRDPADRSIALEVSGVDSVDLYRRRLIEKIRQVSQHPNGRAVKAACVVELSPPRCRLQTLA